MTAAQAFLVDANSTITPRIGMAVDSAGAATLLTHDSSGAQVLTTVAGGGSPAPVTVSGTAIVGNTLTALLATGWSATGYQWLRDGSAISGATSSTYVLQSADGGHAVSVTASGLTFTPTGATVASVAPPAPAPSPTPTPTPAPPPSSGTSSAVAVSGAKQFTLTSASTATTPFTLGYAFAQGDIPSGAGVVADAVTNLQVTAKNAWPDGSLKFAVLAGSVALTANTSKTVTLSIGTAATGTALTTTNLKATSVTASIACGSFGTVSWATTDWDSPFATHVSGPQMSSWVYRKPVGSDTHLVAWLEVRLFADGSVEVLPWIENGFIKVAGEVNKAASYVFTLGGTARSTQTIDLPSRCRTPLVAGTALSYWLGSDPAVNIRHDVSYLQSTELVPPYRAVVSNSATQVVGLPSTFTPLQQGSFSYSGDAMGSGGYAAPIGLLPEHDVLYLTATAPSIYAAVVRNGYSAGRYPIHYRDETTNRPLRFSQHATTSNNFSSTNDYAVTATGTVPPQWELAHHPSVGYMAYLLTGRYYFIDEVQFAATANYLWSTDAQRNGASGWFEPIPGGVQVRHAAWAFRTLAHALTVTPDADTTMQGEFLASVEANIDRFYARYITTSNNPQGMVEADVDYSLSYGTAGAAAAPGYMASPWMQDFFTGVYGYALAMDLPIDNTHFDKLDTFFAWKALSIVDRFGPDATGTNYWYINAAPYNIALSPTKSPDFATGAGPWFADWNAIYAATKAVADTAQLAAFGTIAGTLSAEILPGADSMWGNIQPALAYAVRHSVAGAADAYNRMLSASNWGALQTQFNTIPVWSVRPLTNPAPSWIRTAPLFSWITIPNSTQVGTAGDPDGADTTDKRLAYSAPGLVGTKVVLAGPGGHDNYGKNHVTAIDIGVESPAWTLLHAASPVIAASGPYEADGQPAAEHCYNSVLRKKGTNVLLRMYTRFTDPSADSYPASNGFDLDINTWAPAGTYADAPDQPQVQDDDGNLYVVGHNFFDILKYVPSTNTWSTIFHGSNDLKSYPQAWDSKRKRIFTFCYGDGQGTGTPGLTCFTVDPQNPTPVYITFNSSSAYTAWLALQAQYQAVEYDRPNDCFWVYPPINATSGFDGNGGTTVYKVTPNGTTVWDISVQSVTGAPPAATVSSLSRFRAVPELGGFVCMPGGAVPMAFFKTSGAASSPAPSPSPPPSPTPSPPPSPTPPAPAPAPASDPHVANLIFRAPLTGSTPVDSVNALTITQHGTVAYQASAPGPAWQIGNGTASQTGNSLTAASFPGVTLPLTIGVIWRQKSGASIASGVVPIGISLDGDDNKVLYLMIDSNSDANAIARNIPSSTIGTSKVSSGVNFSYDTWRLSAAIFASSTSRQAYSSDTGISTADTTSVVTNGTAATLYMGSYPRADMVFATAGFEMYAFAYSTALSKADLDAIFADPTLIGRP